MKLNFECKRVVNFNRALHTIIIPMPMDISTPKIGSNSTWSLEYRK